MIHHRTHQLGAGFLLLLLVGATSALSAADDHGHGHGHGANIELKPASAGVYTVSATVEGPAAAGKDWHIELVIAPAQPAPKAVRLWVGSEDGKGSAKSKAGASKAPAGAYHAHADIPKPLPAESTLWVAIESTDGTVVTAKLALP